MRQNIITAGIERNVLCKEANVAHTNRNVHVNAKFVPCAYNRVYTTLLGPVLSLSSAENLQ